MYEHYGQLIYVSIGTLATQSDLSAYDGNIGLDIALYPNSDSEESFFNFNVPLIAVQFES